jgi:hypothetical protein
MVDGAKEVREGISMEFNAAFMRKALQSALLFKNERVMFVPMPALDQQDLMKLLRESGERLEKLAIEAEMQEGGR